jgi:nucleoside-diphosphate-sugar epimerase
MSGRVATVRVAVIGAGTVVGRAVCEALVASEPGRPVVAVGPRRVAIDGAAWRIVEASDPALARKLKDVDVVVVCVPGLEVADPSTGDASLPALLVSAVTEAGVSRVVLVSSTTVVGPVEAAVTPRGEESAAQGEGTVGPVRALVMSEQAWEAWAAADETRSLGVVRGALLVGEGIDTFLTRAFESPRLLVLDDDRPPRQFTHVRDLASAVAQVVDAGGEGRFTAASGAAVPHEELVERLGARELRLPSPIAAATADRLQRLGATPSGADELGYQRFSWVVAADRLAADGWQAAHTEQECVEQLVRQTAGRTAIVGRRVSRPDAASVGAAGAAVAVLGAAAVLRARRRRLG